tara:strand:- start:290 stop:406 length:117 start_codon:yes stop_codon:yes gene_type:complete
MIAENFIYSRVMYDKKNYKIIDKKNFWGIPTPKFLNDK